MQAGGKPHDRQVNQTADSVITQFPGLGAVGAVPLDSDRGGVDDGEGSGVGGSGDRQADFCRAADGVCDEVATRLHSRVLVRSDGSVVTLILYRPGPLHVVPPRTGLCGQLRTPKREEPNNPCMIDFLNIDRSPNMAHISVRAFGTSMIFHVPKDADMSGFALGSIKSRKDVQRQLDEYLRDQGYDPSESYKW